MASPAMHILFALKILTLLGPTVNKQEFILGTSFPDSRHILHLERGETHIEPVSWQDVVNEPSAFRAGMLFHNLLDILRIQHLEPELCSLPTLEPNRNELFCSLIIKFAEDALIYELVPNWDEIILYFDDISSEEQSRTDDMVGIRRWHELLQNYFRQRPNAATIDQLLQGTGGLYFSQPDSPFALAPSFEMLINNNSFRNRLLTFYNNFAAYLSPVPHTTPRYTIAQLENTGRQIIPPILTASWFSTLGK